MGRILDGEGKDRRCGCAGEARYAQACLAHDVLQVHLLHGEGRALEVRSAEIHGDVIQLDHGGEPLDIDVHRLYLGVDARRSVGSVLTHGDGVLAGHHEGRGGVHREIHQLRLEVGDGGGVGLELGDAVVVDQDIDGLHAGERGDLDAVGDVLVEILLIEGGLELAGGVEDEDLDLVDLEVLDLGRGGLHVLVLHTDIDRQGGIGLGLGERLHAGSALLACGHTRK